LEIRKAEQISIYDDYEENLIYAEFRVGDIVLKGDFDSERIQGSFVHEFADSQFYYTKVSEAIKRLEEERAELITELEITQDLLTAAELKLINYVISHLKEVMRKEGDIWLAVRW